MGGWGIFGGGLIWLLLVIVLILGIAALSAARRMTIFARIGALSMMPATYSSTTCACSCVRARHNTTTVANMK